MWPILSLVSTTSFRLEGLFTEAHGRGICLFSTATLREKIINVLPLGELGAQLMYEKIFLLVKRQKL